MCMRMCVFQHPTRKTPGSGGQKYETMTYNGVVSRKHSSLLLAPLLVTLPLSAGPGPKPLVVDLPKPAVVFNGRSMIGPWSLEWIHH